MISILKWILRWGYCGIMQLHRGMCKQLSMIVCRILEIFPVLEAGRPRSKSGIHALCSLHVALDKAKNLFQHCSECSKLYLVRFLSFSCAYIFFWLISFVCQVVWFCSFCWLKKNSVPYRNFRVGLNEKRDRHIKYFIFLWFLLD